MTGFIIDDIVSDPIVMAELNNRMGVSNPFYYVLYVVLYILVISSFGFISLFYDRNLKSVFPNPAAYKIYETLSQKLDEYCKLDTTNLNDKGKIKSYEDEINILLDNLEKQCTVIKDREKEGFNINFSKLVPDTVIDIKEIVYGIYRDEKLKENCKADIEVTELKECSFVPGNESFLDNVNGSLLDSIEIKLSNLMNPNNEKNTYRHEMQKTWCESLLCFKKVI